MYLKVSVFRITRVFNCECVKDRTLVSNGLGF